MGRRGVILWLALALPAFAQFGSTPLAPYTPAPLPTPLPLTGSGLGNLPPAPTPTGPDGRPLQPREPSAAELREQREAEQNRRAEVQRRELQERVEAAQRAAEEARANTERLETEQKTFQDRIMTAVYVGIAIVILWLISRGAKKA